MKRIVPAVLILIFTISLCVFSHVFISKSCDHTLNDISKFQNKKISADALENSWQKRKEKMSLFVNHGFLDDISIHIGQLTAYDNQDSEYFEHTLKNIKTILAMIRDEQRLSAHSFY